MGKSFSGNFTGSQIQKTEVKDAGFNLMIKVCRLIALIHRQKNKKTSLNLKYQGDRVFAPTKTIINEVKRVWHKGYWDSSTKKRSMILE